MVTTVQNPWHLSPNDVIPRERLQALPERSMASHNDSHTPATIYCELLRKNMNESRRAFLQIDEQQPTPDDDKTPKKPASRKISFKTKTNPSRKNNKQSVTLTASKVAQLTNKYNELLKDENLLNEEPRIARAVRRVNSCKAESSELKKPAKPSKTKVELKKKPSVKHRRRDGDVKQVVRAKISYLESPKVVAGVEGCVKGVERKISVKKQPSLKSNRSRTVGSVRAAIEIFEKRSLSVPNGVGMNLSDRHVW